MPGYSAARGADGIDTVSSRNTLVENSFVRGNDDCIAVKNLDDIDQSGLTVRKCVFWNMPCGNGLEIGFETRSRKTEKVSCTASSASPVGCSRPGPASIWEETASRSAMPNRCVAAP